MKKNFIFLLSFVTFFTSFLSADSTKGKGLRSHTPEQLQHYEEKGKWIVEVQHNKLGAHRTKAHLKENGIENHDLYIAQLPHEEILTVQGLSSETLSQILSAPQATLPSAVNNSTLPSFPPIGDQGMEGSCVGWGSTYYQATHEIGLLNGYNNKTSNQHILSPKWTYNLLNGGQDQGLWPADAFTLLASNGAASIASFPYDGNYLAWDTNYQDWVAAISNRLAPVQSVAGLGGTTQNLNTIKQLLANGHVLTFATYVDSWVYTTVKKDRSNPNSPHVGELAVSWMNGSSGGHFLTIVGYDDNVWIDINGNGKVDTGEKGAFLIANSWSTSWGNKGFIWIAYDAFRSVSAVPKGPYINRVPLGDAMNSIVFSVVPKAVNYQPKLIANFSITQSDRSDIAITSGISNTSSNTPSTTINDFALNNQGGFYEFNGTTVSKNPQTVTFAFDLTDLLSSSTGTGSSRYFLKVSDSSPSYITTLNSYTLTDCINQHTVSCTQVPLTCNNSSVTAFIDYNFNIPSHTPMDVMVTNNQLNITLIPVTGDAIINGIQIQ